MKPETPRLSILVGSVILLQVFKFAGLLFLPNRLAQVTDLARETSKKEI